MVIYAGWLLLKTFNLNPSSPQPSTNKNPGEQREPFLDDKLQRIKEGCGLSLPKTTTKAWTFQEIPYGFAGDRTYWIVAILPKEDFYSVVKELELTEKSNLMEIWPQAFYLEFSQGMDTTSWNTENVANEDTFFSDKTDKKEKTRISAKYENGKLYFKKDITVYK